MTGVQIFTNIDVKGNEVTGDGQAETASKGDADRSFATTEFVQKVGLKFSEITNITGAAALTSTHLGNYIILGGVASYIVDLPDNSSFLDGCTYTFINNNSQDVTVRAFTAQNILDKAGNTNTKVLKFGDILEVTKVSSGSWFGRWLHSGQVQPLDSDLTAIAALGNGAGYLRKTGENSWILDTTMPVIATLNNGMPSYVEPVGGKTISIDTFTVEFALNTGGTRNVYLQFGDDFPASTSFGHPLADNCTLKDVLIYGRRIGSGGATMQIRKNGSTTPAFSYNISANTNQSHINYSVSENFDAGDVIAVYGAASANYSHVSVRLTFAWRD